MAASLYIGGHCALDGTPASSRLRISPRNLLTHAVVFGMTGSGKTGLLLVMVEEALRAGVPVIVLDVKGDLANLGLACHAPGPEAYAPYIDSVNDRGDSAAREELTAAAVFEARETSFALWDLSHQQANAFHQRLALTIFTPGSDAGESLHLLSSLELANDRWNTALTEARNALSAAVSLVLRVMGRDDDPARSREHVLLSLLAEQRLKRGEGASLDVLIGDLREPPIETVGALPLDEFVSANERASLAAALNALLASPTFSAWRSGREMDVARWMKRRDDGRVPAVVVSVAHLDDEARMHVLGIVLEEVLSWTRTRPGTNQLCALVVMDEVYGLVPPHPASPPTRRPIVSLMKQGRAFGVGVVLATQNPMDLDYRTLSNAGLWAVGRLQTDADRARVIEGLTGVKASRGKRVEGEGGSLADTVKDLGPRWFLWRDSHEPSGPVLARTRDTLSWLRGPMTSADLSARKRVG
ncbi:MAG: ATP-binding protein [Myxococcales bacterium]|nr:ATP-binding protein [Myxococcales bacterium]